MPFWNAIAWTPQYRKSLPKTKIGKVDFRKLQQENKKLRADVVDQIGVEQVDIWRFVNKKCMLFLRKDGDIGRLRGSV